MSNPEGTEEFTRFYEATKDAVFRAVLLARGGEVQSSEDAVAEAYEKAFLRWSKVRFHANPTAWVIRTAINARISMWRRHGRKPTSGETSGAPHVEGLDPALLELIRALPKGQREVLALRILLDFSTEQTAEALGVHEGTVKKQLHRALRALRRQLMTAEPQEVCQ